MLEVGTRLRCEHCGAEAIVTNAGDGQVVCHAKPMRVVAIPGSSSERGSTET
jgi:desulfoferrodoxin-like iron-binding protein